MKYVILGADRFLLELVRFISKGGSIDWMGAFDVPSEYRPWIQRYCGQIEFSDAWERLLAETQQVTVLASTWPHEREAQDRRREQLLRLATTHFPLIAVHPPCDPILGYQVAAEWHDRPRWRVFHEALLDENYRRFERIARKLFALYPEATVHLIVDRQMTCDSTHEVRTILLRDLLLVERLAGRVRRVGGWGGALAGGPFQLALQMETDRGALVRWNLGQAPSSLTRWTAQVGANAFQAEEGLPALGWRLIGENWSLWANEATDVARRESLGQQSQELCCWDAAIHAEEVLESIESAVTRGRNVEVFRNSSSPDAAFKSRMAVGSCLLLLFFMTLLLVGAVIEGFRCPFRTLRHRSGYDSLERGQAHDTPDSQPPMLWRLWPAYPLLLFLLFPILRWAMGAGSRTASKQPPTTAKG